MDYQTQYQEYKALADAALNTYFADTTVSYHRLLEAMHYSLTAGGKRLRPVLVLAFCAACGGDVRAALQLRVRSRWCILIRSSTTICRAWITMICAAASRRTTWSMASARRRWRATPAGGGIPHDPFDGAAGGCARRVRAPARRGCR